MQVVSRNEDCPKVCAVAVPGIGKGRLLKRICELEHTAIGTVLLLGRASHFNLL